ncbi:hypothetical protein SRHO_G00029320 [Serrasalmus rhombeus]
MRNGTSHSLTHPTTRSYLSPVRARSKEDMELRLIPPPLHLCYVSTFGPARLSGSRFACTHKPIALAARGSASSAGGKGKSKHAQHGHHHRILLQEQMEQQSRRET